MEPNEMEFLEFDVSDVDISSKAVIAANKDPLVRLQYLIDNTPAIIYSSVPTGDFKMTFVSSNAQRMLGYDANAMVADPNFWFDHIHPDDTAAIFSSLALIFTEGQRAYEYRFKRSDGVYVWMQDSLRLIRDESGNPLEIVGSLTDISERKKMEEALQQTGAEQKQLIANLRDAKEQLIQSEKMASVGQLAAGIAHEINNPVGFVNSNLGSLQTYTRTLLDVIEAYNKILHIAPLNPDIKAFIEKIRKKADLEFLAEDINDLFRESLHGLKRVRDIVQSLKDFAHIGESEWQISDIHHGIDSTLTVVNSELGKTQIVKEYGKLPQIKCLASQLNQVFMNIIVNAAYAATDSGTITIRSGADADWVWVSISDTGPGIPAENLSRIFDPFFTTKPVGTGTGLGLSNSYNIINKHKGRIEVSSEVGKGACFTVYLPIKSADTSA